MVTIEIVAMRPIQLLRPVTAGEVLATIELERRPKDRLDLLELVSQDPKALQTEHDVRTLLVMLQQKQAGLKAEQTPEDEQGLSTAFAEVLKTAKATAKTIELLAANGVANVAQAKAYLEVHAGSFESIDGIGEKTNAALLKALA